MAQLDRFLAAMSEYKAEALILEQNRAPAFRFDGGTKPVSRQVLDTERILGLIAELTGDPVGPDDGREFQYDIAGHRYQGRIETESGGIVATIHQVVEEMSEPPSGGVPKPPAGAYRADSGMVRAIPTPPEDPAPSVDAIPSPAPTHVGEGPSAPEATRVADEPHNAPAHGNGHGNGRSVGHLPTVGEVQLEFQVPDDLPQDYRRRIDALLREMVQRGASDLHLCCKHGPVFRVDGHVQEDTSRDPIDADELFRMLFSITPQRNREQFLETHDTDFAYAIPEVSRYRANLFFDRWGPGAVFRAVPNQVIPADQLGLSPEVQRLATLTKGLVLVTGPTGSGKSTTLAALLDLVNEQRSDHIITIEDPVEFVHTTKRCLVNQREVGVHTSSFKAALRAALREDPDVVLVGELRDLETMEMAIETAETGHLVFGTLHTTTAASTVDRIIDQFPADRQAQIRVMLSESLRAVISQTLVPKVGGGRVAAHEVLFVGPSISNLIREGKTFQIESQLQTGRRQGMQTLNTALIDLVRAGKVTPQDAWMKAIDRQGLKDALERSGVDTSSLVG
jgi:twitching motility protein PilT